MNSIKIDPSGDHIGCQKASNFVLSKIGNYTSSSVVFQLAVDTKNDVVGMVVVISEKLAEKFGVKLDGCASVKEYDAFASQQVLLQEKH